MFSTYRSGLILLAVGLLCLDLTGCSREETEHKKPPAVMPAKVTEKPTHPLPEQYVAAVVAADRAELLISDTLRCVNDETCAGPISEPTIREIAEKLSQKVIKDIGRGDVAVIRGLSLASKKVELQFYCSGGDDPFSPLWDEATLIGRAYVQGQQGYVGAAVTRVPLPRPSGPQVHVERIWYVASDNDNMSCSPIFGP